MSHYISIEEIETLLSTMPPDYTFSEAYGDNEPEYSLADVKEINPDFDDSLLGSEIESGIVF